MPMYYYNQVFDSVFITVLKTESDLVFPTILKPLGNAMRWGFEIVLCPETKVNNHICLKLITVITFLIKSEFRHRHKTECDK